MRDLGRQAISTVFLLLLCVSILNTFSLPAVAQPNTAPTAYERISPDATTSGTISGTNQEDYYSINLATGCYNITLQSKNHQLTCELYQVSRGQLSGTSLSWTTSGDYRWTVETFFPTINLASAYVGYLASYGLDFVSPPAGNYVIRVYYPGGTYPYPLPLDYNLTVTTAVELSDIVSAPAQMYNLLQGQTAILHFNCSTTDIYCVNVTWTDDLDGVELKITDKRGLIMAWIGPNTGGITGERMYVIMNETVRDYYISAYLDTDSVGTVGTNVTVDVVALDAMELTSGGIITGDNATFTNPIETDREFQFYILQYKQGYMYNITLDNPATADYNLYIFSPSFILGSASQWTNWLPSEIVGNGVPENITLFRAAVGYYAALCWFAGPFQMQRHSTDYTGYPLPEPFTYMIVVQNATVGLTENFTLRSTEIEIPTYNATTDTSLSYTYPQFGMFKVLTKPGYEYEITWSYNASTDLDWTSAKNRPTVAVNVPLPMLYPFNIWVKGVVPEYESIPACSAIMMMAGGSQNGTIRGDTCSTVLGWFSVSVYPGAPPGIPPTWPTTARYTNMTLVITEKPATQLTLNTWASGDLSAGQGDLYKISLVHGTYRLVVNRTTAVTGLSVYPFIDIPVTVIDKDYNYVDLGAYNFLSSDYSMSNSYTYLNVPEDGDYYIWLQAPGNSETSYRVVVQPIIVAGLWEFLLPVLIGLGIGLVVGVAIIHFVRKK